MHKTIAFIIAFTGAVIGCSGDSRQKSELMNFYTRFRSAAIVNDTAWIRANASPELPVHAQALCSGTNGALKSIFTAGGGTNMFVSFAYVPAANALRATIVIQNETLPGAALLVSAVYRDNRRWSIDNILCR
ncbi:MAG: hypothetical protein HZC28_05725 [Spirochaetes bacterium]|nr:hypothetical protein [Spirochaetota bacterium]